MAVLSVARRNDMARRKPKKLRVSLHGIRNRIEATDKVLAAGIKSASASDKAKMLRLRRTLKQVRSALSSECCDNVWVCLFDSE
jgi:phage gp36-like protein